jgi:succinylglutamate desuccinylase
LKALLSILAFITLSHIAMADVIWSDSGVRGPKYSEILTQLENLKKSYPDLVTVVDYGKSVRGRVLRMVTVMKKTTVNFERPTLLMSGSTHGNEYLNIEDRLPAEMLKKSNKTGAVGQFLDQGGAFVFIPILNPDGYESHSRENAHGVDLNRDWDVPPAGFKGFKEKETRELADQLEKLRKEQHLKFEITVDYHCCIGALLHPWSFKDGPLVSQEQINRFKEVGAMVTRHLDVNVGTTGQILGYHPSGTTKDYYFQKYQALSFTYEGKHQTEPAQFAQHVAWWEEMIKMINGSLTQPFVSAWPVAKAGPMKYFAD